MRRTSKKTHRSIMLVICILYMLSSMSFSEPVYATGDRAISVTGGFLTGGMILDDYSLWTWGSNWFGMLGDGTEIDRKTPVKVMDNVKHYYTVNGGGYQSFALKNDNTLWAWGYIDLGNGEYSIQCRPQCIMEDVEHFETSTYGENVQHCAAIKKDGSLWMWGDNSSGEIGDGTTADRPTPVKVMDDVEQVSVAFLRSAAIKSDGTLWVWGSNTYGYLGDGTYENKDRPVKIMDDAYDVELSRDNSAVIKKDGTLWVWGRNDWGQLLGDGSYGEVTVPTRVMSGVKKVCMGNFILALKNDNSLWMWGTGRFVSYWVGNPDAHIVYPIRIMDNVETIASGPSNSYSAIKSDKSLWVWGYNAGGSVGNGNRISTLSPVKVLDGVEMVSMGSGTTRAVKDDGSVWSWGFNEYGEIGDGTTIDRLNPVKIFPITSITADIVRLSTTSVTYNGKKHKPAVMVDIAGTTLVKDQDYTLTYQNNVNAGTAEVIVEGKGGYAGSVTKNFTINKASITSSGVSIPSATRVYNGKAYQPSVTVKVAGRNLVKGQDYTVTYQNNVNCGTAKAIVKGKGNYTGTVTKTFKISPKTIPASTAKINGGSRAYNKKGHQPSVTIKVSGRTLVKSRDYILKYLGNVNVGTARVIVAGKGNYKGSFTKTFTINPDRIRITRATTRRKGGTTEIDLSISKSICNPTYLQIQLAHDKGFKKQIKLSKPTRLYKSYVGRNGKLPTFKKSLSKKKHYMRMRVVKKVGNKSYCGAWSNTVVIVGR